LADGQRWTFCGPLLFPLALFLRRWRRSLEPRFQKREVICHAWVPAAKCRRGQR
jgi:hypothetical protein